MEYLKITAILATGQIATYDQKLTLDGLLSWVWFRENHPELLAHGAKEDKWPDAQLPLEKRVPDNNPEAWYWAVSFGQMQVAKEYVYRWHRRFAAENDHYIDLGTRKSGRIDIKAGYMKSYRHPIPVILTPDITWYAVGDPEELCRMLNLVDYIGKNRSQGFGWIREWRIEPWHADWSERDDQGWPMRDIPVSEDMAESYEGIRPPYWHIKNRYPVVVWHGKLESRNLQTTG
jgi:CRISPR type IV-associated protein Csf3